MRKVQNEPRFIFSNNRRSGLESALSYGLKISFIVALLLLCVANDNVVANSDLSSAS